MIPEREGGGGIPRIKSGSHPAKVPPTSAREIYFTVEIHTAVEAHSDPFDKLRAGSSARENADLRMTAV